MSEASPILRRAAGGFTHWCAGCESMHYIPIHKEGGPRWDFNGSFDSPTFSPSVRIQYNGVDADQRRDSGRRAPSACCHYFVKDGQIEFCSDSTHELSGKTVKMSDIPKEIVG